MKTKILNNEQDISVLINTPEKHLLFSIIENAIYDFLTPQRTAENEKDIFRKAKSWLFKADKKPYKPFSFGWVLENLEANKELVEVQRELRNFTSYSS